MSALSLPVRRWNGTGVSAEERERHNHFTRNEQLYPIHCNRCRTSWWLMSVSTFCTFRTAYGNCRQNLEETRKQVNLVALINSRTTFSRSCVMQPSFKKTTTNKQTTLLLITADKPSDSGEKDPCCGWIGCSDANRKPYNGLWVRGWTETKHALWWMVC